MHKDVIPDFDKTVAVFIGRTRRATGNLFAVVIEDFSTGAAGAGIAHGPEIIRGVFGAFIIANTDNTRGGHAHFIFPDIVGFIIVGIDGNGQFVGGNIKPLLSR